MTIIYTAPIFTMIFSFIFLRIRQGLWKIFFALLLMIGVILVVKPPFLFPQYNLHLNIQQNNLTLHFYGEEYTLGDENNHWLGVAICFGAALCTGLMNVVFNHLKVCNTTLYHLVILFS